MNGGGDVRRAAGTTLEAARATPRRGGGAAAMRRPGRVVLEPRADGSFATRALAGPGWVELTCEGPLAGRRVLVVCGRGSDGRAQAVVALGAPEGEARGGSWCFFLPETRGGLTVRLVPGEANGEEPPLAFVVRPLSRWEAARAVIRAERRAGRGGKLARALAVALLRGGMRLARRRLFEACERSLVPDGDDYTRWIEAFEATGPEDEEAIRRHVAALAVRPRFSIVLSVDGTSEADLRATLGSVLRQSYPDWELIVAADEASPSPKLRAVLVDHARRESRIRLTPRLGRGEVAGGRAALALARGDYVAFLDPAGELAPHALYHLAAALARNPGLKLLYADEDHVDEAGHRHGPYFKPDWNPDLLLGQNVLAHLAVYQTELVRGLGAGDERQDGAQDYDLALRAVEHLSHEEIGHIPFVLYHRRSVASATGPTRGPGAAESQRRVLEAHLARTGVAASVVENPFHPAFPRVRFRPVRRPLVSAVVLTRDRADLLRKAVDSVWRSGYEPVEVLVVDHESAQAATLRLLERLRERGVEVLRAAGPFNWSAMNNAAARRARGEVLLFLNNDVEACDDGWIEEMVAQLLREGVGAVGAALFYPDGTFQHAGVLVGWDGAAGHLFQGLDGRSAGYFGWAQLPRAVSAVTGACFAVRREVFETVGGFDERLAVAFNDVDFCLKVRAAGWRIVWTPFARLLHHESLTRRRLAAANEAQERRDAETLRQRWGEALTDPYYNPNLTLTGSPFRLAWPPRTALPWREFLDSSSTAAGERPRRDG